MKMDRYVFWGQFSENGEMEKVIAIKTFEEGTSEAIFSEATKQCGHVLDQVYSLMSDATTLNCGKKSEINKRFCKQHYGHGIHTLECLFHVNEIYFTHLISKIEGKKKGMGFMQEGALMKYLSAIRKPDMARAVAQSELNIPNIGVQNGSITSTKQNGMVCKSQRSRNKRQNI